MLAGSGPARGPTRRRGRRRPCGLGRLDRLHHDARERLVVLNHQDMHRLRCNAVALAVGRFLSAKPGGDRADELARGRPAPPSSATSIARDPMTTPSAPAASAASACAGAAMPNPPAAADRCAGATRADEPATRSPAARARRWCRPPTPGRRTRRRFCTPARCGASVLVGASSGTRSMPLARQPSGSVAGLVSRHVGHDQRRRRRRRAAAAQNSASPKAITGPA